MCNSASPHFKVSTGRVSGLSPGNLHVNLAKLLLNVTYQLPIYFLGIPELLNYFDTNYVRGPLVVQPAANGFRARRNMNPRLRIPTWNMHELTLNDQPRTNNYCESWNSR